MSEWSKTLFPHKALFVLFVFGNNYLLCDDTRIIYNVALSGVSSTSRGKPQSAVLVVSSEAVRRKIRRFRGRIFLSQCYPFSVLLPTPVPGDNGIILDASEAFNT
uniref:Secreted protein n=1 Tax=Heterorhabditis bacteriophora TaxID=37862 RepID=A0A1I7X6T1_HETBA